MSSESRVPDLKAYILGELSPQEQQDVERRLASDPALRDEFERLRLTQTALLSLREEEMPRRIAFVSDKVFTPAWYQRLLDWPRVALASSAMLAASILIHGFLPGKAPVPVAQAPVAQPAAVDVKAVVDAAVGKALAESEVRHRRQAASLLAASESRAEAREQENRLAINRSFEILDRTVKNLRKEVSFASADLGGSR